MRLNLSEDKKVKILIIKNYFTEGITKRENDKEHDDNMLFMQKLNRVIYRYIIV